MGQLIIIVAMFVLLWLLLIRPQRQRQVAQRELIASVEVGDEILTAGGLYGHVRALGDEDDLVVEIAPGTEVRLARRAVAGIVPPDEELEADHEAAMDELHS
jgi:preprotein translocase subunit YajC